MMRIGSNISYTTELEYSPFDKIDGDHPYRELGKHGYVDYEVLKLNKGKVVYFNFALAKEMGLISTDHKSEMNVSLHQKLIETFSLQIINEYDILNKKRVAKKNVKPKKYMATRYLQLQHQSKKGLTSGDGRSIWNGFLMNEGVIWDISSRGTGVTVLSPGASIKKKPLKTGNTDTGYGCGQAELDELIGSAIMSEVLHRKGIHTERVLCVIDLGKGVGIGVRAGKNLIRPAHAFLFLKQNRKNELGKVIDYYIKRQIINKKLVSLSTAFANQKYDLFLKDYCKRLAKFVAFIEENYIFVWLDWDGDNLLFDAGIIDYGSIRHFGTCHNRYKYDDVDRFSTNLSEQKNKAQLLVKEMIQTVEYLKTSSKTPLRNLNNHSALDLFHTYLKQYSLFYFAQKIGLSNHQIKVCLKDPKLATLLSNLKEDFKFWEDLKTSKGRVKVPDGINYFPLVNMRTVAREFPTLFSQNEEFSIYDFVKLAQTQFCKPKDEKIFLQNKNRYLSFFNNYKSLFKKLKIISNSNTLEKVNQRVNQIHPESFLTGNSLIHCVDDIISGYALTHKPDTIQNLIEKLIDYSHGESFFNRQRHFYSLTNKESLTEKKIWDKIVMNLHEYREEI